MILGIILLALTVLGIITGIKSYNYDFWGIIMAFIFGIWLLIHLISILTMGYYHELFVVKRDAFEQTLNHARINGNKYETAAIVERVADWNTVLAESKFDNNNWFLGQYIDDRVEDLKPIK